ncbi:MAG: AgmX/PglI C-terminal domain-containing protein [Labilithrix sp.]|nr:AgmX/PglI C-terminal domain-containing protein [Labilithrix sp.]MCW5810453.1 AgmX/PglI C-terminal domain-containing protein [Labilithrix sp.]
MHSILFRAAFAASASLVFVLAACGGDPKDPKTPASSSGSDDPSSTFSSSGGGSSGAAESSSGGGGEPTPVGPTTTTTQLGDGGDLQGAKLGGKVHTETESKGESGPASTGGKSANEPGRSLADISAIVKARREDARACYDKALPSHPGMEGNLDIKWTIDPKGNVTEASLDTSKSQILDQGVANCVIDIIKKIKFAESKGGYETRAHYPFDFHPRTFTPKPAGSGGK